MRGHYEFNISAETRCHVIIAKKKITKQISGREAETRMLLKARRAETICLGMRRESERVVRAVRGTCLADVRDAQSLCGQLQQAGSLTGRRIHLRRDAIFRNPITVEHCVFSVQTALFLSFLGKAA